MQSDTILITGASGQVGSELSFYLKEKFGQDAVVCTDIRQPEKVEGKFEVLDVMDKHKLFEIVKKHEVTIIYHLAALLSATAEKNPDLGWKLNMEGLFNVLDLAKEGHIKKVFWPSTIAVFGPTTPKENTPQRTIMEPSTVYGISKQAGERWCEYYFEKYGVDVRSIRYPGLIGYKSLPGGGTTDYAVDIFFEALKHQRYECFLTPGTILPMMYMPDAIKATIDITEAPAEKVKIRSSYNIAGFSFSPDELAQHIRSLIPDFTITYKPDFRQKIAEGWPGSIDDSVARQDWGWKPDFTLEEFVKEMIINIPKFHK